MNKPTDGAEPSLASAGSVAHRLAESLRDMSDTLNACGNDFSDILLDAARELDSRRWIPVTERMPDIGQHVAALTAGGRRFVGYTATLSSRHCWIDRGNEVAVTHWMPLPALPSDG